MIKILASLLIISGLLLASPTGLVKCDDCQKDQMMNNPQGPRFLNKEPKEMMETIKIWKLTEALNLNENQSTRFFPKLKEMRDLRDEFEQNRMKALSKLDDYLKDAKKYEPDIKNMIKDFDENEAKFQEKIGKIKKELSSVLTPEQQAKYMLFQSQFDKEMHEMINKARERWQERRELREEQQEEPKGKRTWRFW